MKPRLILVFAFVSLACGPSAQERRARYNELAAEDARVRAQQAKLCDEAPGCGVGTDTYRYLMLERADIENAKSAVDPSLGY